MVEERIEKLADLVCSGNLEERRRAVEELGSIGPDSVPALISVLETGNNDSRWYASRSLVKVGPSCMEALIEVMRNNSDHDLRRYVAGVFVSLGEPGFDLLVDLLGYPDPHVRGMASMALRKIGAPVVPMLLEVVETTDPENIRRRAAFLTLVDMECVDQEYLSRLIKS